MATKKEHDVVFSPEGLGYAMALKRAAAWIYSGVTLEVFFDVKDAEKDLIPEWSALAQAVNTIRKKT